MRRALLAPSLLLLASACRSEAPGEGGATSAPPPVPASEPSVVGSWRAVLHSPGGELPFTLRIREHQGELSAAAITGAETLPFTRVERNGASIAFAFDHYDARVEATIADGGAALEGAWSKTVPKPKGRSSLRFTAERDVPHRFAPQPEVKTASAEGAAAVPQVAGSWAVTFTDDDGDFRAIAELTQTQRRVTGTFLTATGDYRFLEGDYHQGLMRLSTFDGAHAFLFHARAQADGTLVGDFWSRDVYHATWTARRASGSDAGLLPDPYKEVSVTSEDQKLRFSFSGLDGAVVSSADERFVGKVVLVDLFGSWCPNCNDQAPLLAAWHRKYRDRGLEIVGLAYEFTGEPERDKRVLGVYKKRFGIEFPILLAGVSDKVEAAKTLPDLSAVKSYPTTVFIGRDGRVRAIHSGFAGPGTGRHHAELVKEMESRIVALLDEKP